MKHFITALAIAALANSCSDLRADKVKDFIPGVYVKSIDDEFTKGMDTLVIDVLDKSAGSYSINKKMSYQQVIDGRELSPQYKTESWTAVYDDEYISTDGTTQRQSTFLYAGSRSRVNGWQRVQKDKVS